MEQVAWGVARAPLRQWRRSGSTTASLTLPMRLPKAAISRLPKPRLAAPITPRRGRCGPRAPPFTARRT